jgi:hypothetical protein
MISMYYQLWSIEAGNRIADFKTEAEGLAMVRELLQVGWSADDLALGAFHEDGDPDRPDLPPALSGTELLSRALAVPPGSVPA